MIPRILNIVYTTGRKDPKFEWFASSLSREIGNMDLKNAGIIIHLQVADFYAEDQCAGEEWGDVEVKARCDRFRNLTGYFASQLASFTHVPPKPNVWQGPFRQTRENWWAVSNLRNTAICHARDGWIAFVDDLSFLSPGWLTEAVSAMDGERIICGAYQKVKNLGIDPKGRLVSADHDPNGIDNRMKGLPSPTTAIPCGGRWMYGCSLLAPVEAFLSINGYDERCDGLSFEDCICGIHIEHKGWRFTYNPNMKTLESQELHGIGPHMKRSDYGISPKDKSHKILELATNGTGWSPNEFTGFKDLRELRANILAGGQFPIPTEPAFEWFTGTPLAILP